MYNTFFEKQFSYLREIPSNEEMNKIVKHMVNEFTLHVLSEIHSDDYVIPNYTRKILSSYDYEYIVTPDTDFDYVKVIFPDFYVILEDRVPLKILERDLKNRIMKYSKINAVVLSDDEIDDVDEEMKKALLKNEPNKVTDVVIVICEEPYQYYPGGDVYIRDKNCPYLIHKYLCYDDDVFSVIKETNRSITEFLTKFENEYNSSFFL